MPATPEESTIIFTAIPNGISEGVLRLSVFASFRLAKDPSTLADYPDVLDWPDRDITFTVSLGGQQIVATPDNAIERHLPDWQILFPSSTTVVERAEAEDHSSSRVRSFSAKSIAADVTSAHLRFATKHPTTLPPTQELLSRFSHLRYKSP